MNTAECKRVDLWDGGERHSFGFYISIDADDKEIYESYPHCMITRQLITVYESIEEVKSHSVKELRKSAWRKLSQQEREALGMLEEPK